MRRVNRQPRPYKGIECHVSIISCQPQRAGLIVRVGTDTGKPYWLGWQRIAFIDTQHRPDRKWHFSFSGGPDGCLIFHAVHQLHTPGSNFNKTMDWAWDTLKENTDGPIPITARLIKVGESFYKDT